MEKIKVSVENSKHSQEVKKVNKDLEKLQENEIYPSTTGDKENYFCRVCYYTCDTRQRALEHSKKSRHIEKLKSLQQSEKLYYIPSAGPVHMQALDIFLGETVQKKTLSVEEVKRRKSTAERIISTIQSSCPDLEVHLFGSLTTGLSIEESDVNISVWFKDASGDVSPGSTLLQVLKALKPISAPSCEILSENSADYFICNLSQNSKGIPSIMAIDDHKVLYKISYGNQSDIEGDALIRTYCQVDKRCMQLALLLRSFAKIAYIDQPERGSMISRIFPVLVIFYLQNKRGQPVLPNLHRIVETNPFHLPSESVHTISGIPGISGSARYLSDLTCLDKFFDVTRNTENLAELWLGLLRFYLFDFNKDSYLVSITDFHPVTRVRGSKQLGVQDPIDMRRNLCCTVTPLESHSFIREQLEGALRYFSVPQMRCAKSEWGAEPLYTSWKLAVAEDFIKSASGDVKSMQVGLTTVYTSQRSYTSPLKKIEENMNDFLQCNSENVKAPIVKLSEFLPQLNKWTLESICLQTPTTEIYEIDDWSVDVTPLQQQSDQGLRLQRFAAAFCRQVWDKIWREYFSREEYVIKLHELRIILQEAARDSLSRDILSGKVAIKEPVTPDTKLSLCLSECSDSKTLNDLLPKNQGTEDEEDDEIEEVMDDEFYEPDELEDEDSPGILVDRERIISETVQQDSMENACLVPYGKSGWAVALHRQKTNLKVVDCNKKGSYYSKLVQDRVKKIDKLHFVWDKCMLTHRNGLVLTCSLCSMKGHLRDDCTEFLPSLTNENNFTSDKLEQVGLILGPMLIVVQKIVEPTKAAIKEREKTFKRLKSLIEKAFPEAQLRKFGSSINGFGSLRSDLDLNLRLPNEIEPVLLPNIVARLEQFLGKSEDFVNVQGIKSAKVPVVKFSDASNNIEGDITFSNLMALENSRLLSLYSVLNEHCHTLGLVLKYLMKACGVCDASCGSLSSYAYIILLIHYLQHRNCLPALQKIYEGDTKPVNFIEGFDCWFQDDLEVIMKHWHPPDPLPSLGELWLGFFKYYLYEFDYTTQVATIRIKEKLLKTDKLWTNCSLAIEDPFELSHNLGKSLSRKMFCFIFHVFNEVLKAHCKADKPLTTFSEIVDQYFNPNQLLKGQVAPKERGCRRCGKIGHLAAACPQPETPNSSLTQSACIPLKNTEKSANRASGQNGHVSLLCLTPRTDNQTFMSTQPFGQFGWPPNDGFSVEPMLIPIGNNDSVLIPVLTHPNKDVMRNIAQRLSGFGQCLSIHGLQELHLRACNPAMLVNMKNIPNSNIHLATPIPHMQRFMDPSLIHPGLIPRPVLTPQGFPIARQMFPMMAPMNYQEVPARALGAAPTRQVYRSMAPNPNNVQFTRR